MELSENQYYSAKALSQVLTKEVLYLNMLVKQKAYAQDSNKLKAHDLYSACFILGFSESK